ncbi:MULTISPECIES: protein-export chaperone SecB [Sediminimonas]|uniref:Protein-export protein SecB n=1 Tax=Sediminimonas qiaohouensis TaxID=552061 RepID=A0A7C9L7V7_9RHOB|nr:MULTISPECIES: protein-export chaperone SecB [Sediminimonas]MDR9484705.1 protein-export chaperone SecB [Sediminimonas sp.]MTJ04615.1 protein-export chaperone SecB [Sediminimonas qiaohouensis]
MAENGNGQAEAPQIKMNILTQYIRDMSFENILSQKGSSGEVQPDVSVQVNLDAKKRSTENQYEVLMKMVVDSSAKDTGDKMFLLELEYAGVFHIEGVPEDQLHPFLLIECPRMIFPFARRIVSDVTRDGGFPPLNLDNIDFVQLYRNELARRKAQQGEQAPETPDA